MKIKSNNNPSALNASRRQFIKNMTFAASSAAIVQASPLLMRKSNRVKKGRMYYRRLGKTNLFISEVSLGGSPLPEESLLHEAVERGVNYIDTSSTYMNGNSERMIGRLIKDIGRDKIHVATKFHLRGENWTEESIIKDVNSSMRRLDTDYLDILLIHGARKESHLTDKRVIKVFERLKKEGKYRFRGLSCHTNHHRVVKKAVECGYYDMVQLGYNVFDILDTKKEIKVYDDYLGESGIRHLLSLAHSNDVGVIAMKTLKVGGKRQNLDKYKTGSTTLIQAMLKWVLENKNVTSAVIEMLTYEQLEEDLGAVGIPLTNDERQSLFRYVAENSHDYCHMCGLCQASCPSRIETTAILRCLTYYESYVKKALAKETYSSLKPEQTASFCKSCGECERACPYGVSIRNRIREAHKILA
ncbi:MAG: aldo/keto reductase [Candidatus Aminicenantaceae bacterium]